MTTSSSTRTIRRRDVFRVAAAGSAAIALAGCGGDEQPNGPTSASPSRRTGAFPVTIKGSEGPTTIETAPSRIVSVGQYRDTDAAVALGIVPLATSDLSTFIPGGISPWVRDHLTGKAPTLFGFADGLPFEQLAALRPDLILATDHSGLGADYATLTGIAPTLSTVAGYNKDTWQTTTTRIGTALGRSERAAALITKVENALAAARRENPAFAGRTFTIGPVQADGTLFTINTAADASARFMAQLSLKLSPAVGSLPRGTFPGRATVGPERLDALDADVMILTFNTPQARTRLEANPLFKRIPAVERGSHGALDLPTAIALAFPTALSIPYALHQSIPKIAAALAR